MTIQFGQILCCLVTRISFPSVFNDMVLISSETSPESPLTFVFLSMVFSKRSSLYPASSPKTTSTVSQVFFAAAPHFSAPQSVSVCFGCHNKASQTGRLDTWDVFPRSSVHSGLKIGVPAGLFSGACSLPGWYPPSCCVLPRSLLDAVLAASGEHSLQHLLVIHEDTGPIGLGPRPHDFAGL